MSDPYTLLSWAAFVVEVMSFVLVDLLIPVFLTLFLTDVFMYTPPICDHLLFFNVLYLSPRQTTI